MLQRTACSIAVSALITGSLVTYGCGSSPTSMGIGPEGGKLTSGDGRVTLVIPAGALKTLTTVTLSQVDSPAAGSAGEVFDIGPTGTVFAKPATLSFPYDEVALGSHSATDIEVLTYASSKWTALPSAVDAKTKTVSASLAHLSTYGIGFTVTVDGNCKVPAGNACAACDSGLCTGSTPYALCVAGIEAGDKTTPFTCTTPASCTCAAQRTCSAPGNGCGPDCAVSCDGAAPYPVCIAGVGGTGGTKGGTSGAGGCDAMPSCTCSPIAPDPSTTCQANLTANGCNLDPCSVHMTYAGHVYDGSCQVAIDKSGTLAGVACACTIDGAVPITPPNIQPLCENFDLTAWCRFPSD
jgi:hypothetical protein